MKRKIFFILSLFLICSFYTFGESFPQKAKSVKDFIPKGWEQLNIAKGDLNKDQLEDVVIVIGNPVINSDDDSVLLVLFKEKDGTYSLVAKNDKNFSKSYIIYPILDEIRIKNNILEIKFYTLALYEFNTIYTFRFQNNRFELIGFDESGYSRGNGEQYRTSINFSTNKMKTTTGGNTFEGNENNPKDEWYNIKIEKKYTLDEMTESTIDEILEIIDY